MAVHGRRFFGHLPLLRAWVRAEAAAVLAAAEDVGLLSTFPAALAARAEVVSLRCLVIRSSPLARRESPATSTDVARSRNGRNINVTILGSLT